MTMWMAVSSALTLVTIDNRIMSNLDQRTLESNTRDKLVSIANSAAGALPVVGTLISEVMTTIIPDLRLERIVAFLKQLDSEVASIHGRLDTFEQHLQTEEGLDLLEEGCVQASRAVSADRKERLGRLVAKALSAEELRYEESRKLLNIYRELTDPEIVWLIYYSMNPVFGDGPHKDWVKQHPEILEPVSKTMGASPEQLAKAALQESYKQTLQRFGLVEQKGNRFSVTTFGRMLVQYIQAEE
ncbi:hypothetical protein [Marinobacter salarius]|uniref:hypothetical protein n=1 Tax=Marinobacter salarius TaxID=1420917 RepID=UPI0025A4CA90|nr:hypothetical protein [Marinobacter salarius]MDM8181023.1 hypothetical protein [Marinobacter salarius]